MIYDEKKHYDLVFSENQTPGFFSSFPFEYSRRVHEQLMEVSEGKPVIKSNYLPEAGIGMLVLIASVMTGLALHIFLPCGKSVIFHIAAASVIAFAGLLSLISNKPSSRYQFYIDRTARRLTGILLLIEAVLIPVMWLNLPFETDWECNYFMGGVFCVVMGLYNVVSLLMFFTRRSRIYTVSVEADCIGYVRVNNSNGQKRSHWYHSPVFSYYLDGREIIAFCDTLTRGIDAKIPLGPYMINVNRDDAGSVMNPSLKGVISKVIITAILLYLGISLIIGVLNGGVEGTSIAF